jgi:hypothetical protein
MWHARGKREIRTGCLLGNLNARDHFENAEEEARILKTSGGKGWTGFTAVRTGNIPLFCLFVIGATAQRGPGLPHAQYF